MDDAYSFDGHAMSKDLSKDKIYVVVVESHHHVLEHIHHILRRRRLLNSTWSMLHFDSHADLACPGSHIPAFSCFQPRKAVRMRKTRGLSDVSDERSGDDSSSSSSSSKEDGLAYEKKMNLYELLDSTASGIAEWILPLVLAANLRAVHWVRPPGTVRQIPAGLHNYNVGAWLGTAESSPIESFLDLPLTATVKVDWGCRYYLEDDTFVSENELVLSQPLRLNVSEGSSMEPSDSNQLAEDIFALDVCLDYFACLNPFVTDIEVKDVALAKALVLAVTESRFYCGKLPETYQVDLTIFHQLLKECLKSCSDVDSYTRYQSSITALQSYYDAPKIGMIEALRATLMSHRNQDERDDLIEMAVDAIPNVTMPHSCIGDGIAHDTIQERLGHFSREIRHRCSRKPFVVTVARSTNDGFTPKSVVEEVQVMVLQEIHECYCRCATPCYLKNLTESNIFQSMVTCRLSVIYDYGPSEGFTFLDE